MCEMFPVAAAVTVTVLSLILRKRKRRGFTRKRKKCGDDVDSGEVDLKRRATRGRKRRGGGVDRGEVVKRRRLLRDTEGSGSVYARIDLSLPLLQLYFDDQKDLMADFRLSRQSMHRFLKLMPEEDHGWGRTIEVLVFVYWLAHGLSYRETAKAFNMPKSTVCRLLHKISAEIRRVVREGKVIHYPRRDQVDNIGRGFAQVTGHDAFSKVVGVIEGCHICIKPPQLKQDYFNNKRFHSIQLQAVCDSTGRFINVFIGYPGSVHEASVFRNSPLYKKTEYPPQGYFLLAGGSYPCLEMPVTVMTPYSSPEGRAQERFNRSHSKAMSVIKRVFGAVKTRWTATLSKDLEVKLSFCSDVVLACAFLHNISLANGEELEPEFEHKNLVAPPDPPLTGSESCGAQLRDQLCAELSLPVVQFQHLTEHDYL